MKKDDFKDLVSKVAALGVPGVVLTAAIGASGYAGAAALTTALATLGGPMGMLGGIAILGLLTLLSQAVGAYGFDVVFDALIDELGNQGKTKAQIYAEVESYPIPDFVKKWVKDAIDARVKFETKLLEEEQIYPLYFTDVLQPEFDKATSLEKATTGRKDKIVITENRENGNWLGVRLVLPDKVEVAYLDPKSRLFVSPTNALTAGEIYRLKDTSGQGERCRVEVLSQIARGYWLGVMKNQEANKNREEIVAIVHRV